MGEGDTVQGKGRVFYWIKGRFWARKVDLIGSNVVFGFGMSSLKFTYRLEFDLMSALGFECRLKNWNVGS